MRLSTATAIATMCLSLLPGCDPAPEAMQPADAREPEVEDEPAPPSDETPPSEEEECVTVPKARPRLMFVLDKSSSMAGGSRESSSAPAPGELSRWAQLHALVGALAGRADEAAQFGAVLFPSSYAEASREAACDVRTVPEVAMGVYAADDLLGRLPAANVPEFFGGSPVQAAYATALDHLGGLGDAAPAAIVLITDGGINCVDDVDPLGVYDTEFADMVASARDELKIPTFVVGIGVDDEGVKIPNANLRPGLREIALAGGEAHGELGYFSPEEPGALVKAVEAFIARAQDEVGTVTTCA